MLKNKGKYKLKMKFLFLFYRILFHRSIHLANNLLHEIINIYQFLIFNFKLIKYYFNLMKLILTLSLLLHLYLFHLKILNLMYISFLGKI